MSPLKGKLIFFCGKMAAGKSTLSRKLASEADALLFVEDEYLERLFPGEITDVATYVKYSSRIRDGLGPHICSLLSRGLPVVLDFPGNTRTQRRWFRQLIDQTGVEHELHFIDASDSVCLRQLMHRSQGRPAASPWTTETEFRAITSYFEPPGTDEGFFVVRHERA